MPKSEKELSEIVEKLKSLAKDVGKTPTLSHFMTVCSRRAWEKYGKFNDIVRMAGLEPNNPLFQATELGTRPPKVLIYDIETSAIKAHVWGGYDQNVGANQVIEDWYVLSWAAKWLDEETIFYEDMRSKKPHDDRKLMEGIHKLICDADIIVAHNGDKFDIKKLNARFLKHGMPPLSPYRSIDTLKIARRYFKLTFNTLAYVAKYLGLDVNKSEHKKFPGMELWNACMGKDKKLRLEAFQEMEAYNKMDVVVLEAVLKKLMPYDPSIKFSAFHQTDTCSCGSRIFVKDGFDYKVSGASQRFRCKGCGKIFKDKKNLIDKDIRKGIMS